MTHLTEQQNCQQEPYPAEGTELIPFKMSLDLTRVPVQQTALRLENGQLKVEQYAKALLARIAARNPEVHAWAYIDHEYVLAQARKLDKIPAEKRGPLHGVPVAIKDVALTKGDASKYVS
jgi:Asp-tRNA(Asn)/Glu-tRNA(Gln) amidotransferase A subunit family amidase